MKNFIPYFIVLSVLLSGCAQIVTAPISLAGSAIGATIDVAGSTAKAVSSDD